jgi:hypothetical protein
MDSRVFVRSTAVFCAVAAVMTVSQPAGEAQAPDALPFAKSYTVTGNYVVGGVDLKPDTKAQGFLNGTIPISGVPANADVLAAFLYWETLSTNIAQVDGATFRGQPVTAVKATSQVLDTATAQCFTSGKGGASATYTVTEFRADVLRLLPAQLDSNGKPTGRRIVNDTDLLNSGLPLHAVKLPDGGTGNLTPQSPGASLFVVYRSSGEPLTKIVLYDGIRVQARGEVTSQTIRGFFQSSASRTARMTHIVGSGGPNPTNRLWFSNGREAPASVTGAFATASAPASDRAWSNPTLNVTSMMPGVDLHTGPYGVWRGSIDQGRSRQQRAVRLPLVGGDRVQHRGAGHRRRRINRPY